MAAAVHGYHHHHQQHRDTQLQENPRPMTPHGEPSYTTLGEQLYFRCFGDIRDDDSTDQHPQQHQHQHNNQQQQQQRHHHQQHVNANVDEPSQSRRPQATSTTADDDDDVVVDDVVVYPTATTATTATTHHSTTFIRQPSTAVPLIGTVGSDVVHVTDDVGGGDGVKPSIDDVDDDANASCAPADVLDGVSDYKGVRRRRRQFLRHHRQHEQQQQQPPQQQYHQPRRERWNCTLSSSTSFSSPPTDGVTVPSLISRLSDSHTGPQTAAPANWRTHGRGDDDDDDENDDDYDGRNHSSGGWPLPLVGGGARSVSVCVMYAILMCLCVLATPTAAAKQEGCTFPARWEGSWFLSGNQQPVFIKGSTLSFRGKCIASEGDKFLVADEKGCHRCLVMYEKHRNVLQYKESECEGDNMYMDQSNPAAMPMREQPQRSILNSDHRGAAHPNTNGNGNNHGHARVSSSDPYSMRSHDDTTNDCPSDYCKGRENLQTLCEQIAGDALLYSLFKEDAEPVKCPLRGPYTFTYNRGHGECMNPVSNIESCTEDSRLLLSFQACPDVSGTESTVEELTCLATWKDGNSRYLVGLVSHHHAISNEERYRCFVYEKLTPGSGGSSKDEYKLAQSGDATCNGLDSAEVGSRIMTLQMAPTTERCDFPTWFKGPKKWHALMGNTGYNFHQSDGSLHIIKASNGVMETRALCEQINKQTPTEMMSVVHYTTGCQSGFMCMMFYRRDVHVAEIQMGTPASRLEDACAPDHFDVVKLPFITLLASNPEAQECPLQGLYGLRGAVGPPSISSRHKRNHNSKGHTHHHHASGKHRHSTLSFRNPDEFDHTSWRAHSRGLPKRNRRDTARPSSVAGEPVGDRTASSSSLSSSSSAASTEPSLPPSTPTPTTTFDPIIGEQDDDSGGGGGDESNGDSNLAPPPTPRRRPSSAADRRNATRSRRDTPGCIVNYAAPRQLLIGCQEANVIEVRPQCNEEGDEVYHCHGSWVENDTTFIVAWHPASQHGVCISFVPLEGNAARLIVGDACRRGHQAPADHHLAANLTVYGSCSDPSTSTRATPPFSLLWMVTLTLVVCLFAR